MLFSSVCMFGFTSVGAAGPDLADLCFLAAVESDDGADTYTRKPLYDENLEQSGWQYNFTAGDKSGYALLTSLTVNGKKVYETEEVNYSDPSPFDDCAGLPVYISHKCYIEYRGGVFYDLTTGGAIDDEKIAECAAIGFTYNGSANYTEKEQIIWYATKATTQEYSIQYDLPPYHGMNDSTNCACVAGSVAIGYYDRFNENLIPNYKVYTNVGPIFIYKQASAQINNVLDSLYQSMGTDVGAPGTTFAGFQSGMDSYVRGQGYTYTTEDLFSWGRFDFDKFKASVHAGKPVGLFLHDFAVLMGIETTTSRDVVKSRYCDTAHVTMACGYRVDTYYNALGGVIDTRTYLRVNVGLEYGIDIGYLNINELTTINHAISITIN